MSRYARQMSLPDVGTAGQARLAQAHVLVVGAGGLGCPVLQYLAGAGVGAMDIMDHDQVEEGNLHRQPLYTMDDIGAPKAEAARARLRAANPDLRLTPMICRLTPANVAKVVAQADVVIDAADSFAASYILSDTCLEMGKPLISASVLGQSGYVGGYCGGVPSLRAVFPELPEQAATCATAGVLGPAVGVIGSLQAQVALRVLLDLSPSPLGRLVSVDLEQFQFGGFSFADAPEPEGGFRFVCRSQLTPADRVIELRPESEAPHPATPEARRLDPRALETLEVSPDQRTVLCCATGLRAWRSARALSALGHRNIALLAASCSA
jgi:molybdopterin/thiamine biosynthesis adenylyltransferase